jgi:DNA-binding MarR family transcriptional regulator
MATDPTTSSAAVLLTQLGAHAASRYAERMRRHGLTPAQADILGRLRANPGISQQQLAHQLGLLASRVVGFVDELEAAGLVQRLQDGADRRRNCLELTPAGTAMLRTIATVTRAHDAEICAALSARQRTVLTTLLARMAEQRQVGAADPQRPPASAARR